MSAFVLITGALFRAPEQRVSKAGKAFWTTTVRVRDSDATAWWKILVFSESAGAELMRLGDGDAISAQGVFKVELYDKDGETRVALTVFADRVLPLKSAPRERKPKAAKEQSRCQAQPEERCRVDDDRSRVDDDLDDDIGDLWGGPP